MGYDLELCFSLLFMEMGLRSVTVFLFAVYDDLELCLPAMSPDRLAGR